MVIIAVVNKFHNTMMKIFPMILLMFVQIVLMLNIVIKIIKINIVLHNVEIQKMDIHFLMELIQMNVFIIVKMDIIL